MVQNHYYADEENAQIGIMVLKEDGSYRGWEVWYDKECGCREVMGS